MDARVFIVESDCLVRRSIEVLVSSLGYHASSYDNLEQFASVYDPTILGCVLVGVVGPLSLQLTQLSAFLAEQPSARVILMTDGCETPTVVRAMRSGFSSVIEHPMALAEFQSAVEAAIAEKRAMLHGEKTKLPADIAALLTRQEEMIVHHLIDGAGTKEIASKMDLSVRTIHYRKNSIFKKIGAKSREHALQILS